MLHCNAESAPGLGMHEGRVPHGASPALQAAWRCSASQQNEERHPGANKAFTLLVQNQAAR